MLTLATRPLRQMAIRPAQSIARHGIDMVNGYTTDHTERAKRTR